MVKPIIEQNSGYALGNFIMLTPGIKRLSEKVGNKIDVYFTIPYVKECFIDCDFMNHVGKLRNTTNNFIITPEIYYNVRH